MSFQSWCPVLVRHFVVKSIKKQMLASLGSFGFLLLGASLCLAQNSSSSSGSSGHSSAPSAPSFGASAPVSHAPAGSGASYSANAPHTPGMPGHNPGNPQQPTQPHPRPGGNNGTGSTGEVYYAYPYAVLVPYPADGATSDADANASSDADDDAEYQGGPTVFDRRGSGAASYIPPVDSVADQSQADESQSENTTEPNPEPPVDPTVLVFKDGHQLEIQNYAVVSETLYDLTPGHRRKIDLAELDLPATEKLNDDRGIVFELPASSQAN
jgi:hypothetical protein